MLSLTGHQIFSNANGSLVYERWSSLLTHASDISLNKLRESVCISESTTVELVTDKKHG